MNLVVALLGATALCAATDMPCSTKSVAPAAWAFRGPGSYTEDAQSKLAWSSATAAVAHGANDTWFVGAVNGGVWRTTSGMHAGKQHWEPVTDGQPVRCSSIGALATGAAVGRPEVVVAGCGFSTSSMMGVDWNVGDTGDFGGLLFSLDSGDTWAMAEGFPENYNIGALTVLRNSSVLVGARSHFLDREDGGMWRGSLATPQAAFARVYDKPVYALARHGSTVLAARPFVATDSVVRSDDGGSSWSSFAEGIDWLEGRVAFYPALDISADGTTAFVGALTVKPVPEDERLQVNTSGAIFTRNLSATSSEWILVPNTPRLDNDCMPKDRMALLADPTDASILYVAGNANYNTYRVRHAEGHWTNLRSPDGAEPHSDDRNYAWDPSGGGRLVIVTDGGVSVRDDPHSDTGQWRSANGDMGTMEMLAASYDPVGDRWIACAQDNTCMLSPPGAKPDGVANSVVGGDGTVTAVDVRASPPRLFGGVQSFGTEDEEEEEEGRSWSPGDEGDDKGDGEGKKRAASSSGLRFVQGDLVVDVPVPTYFESRQMPFFVQPFALNAIEPTKVLLWANSSTDGQMAAGIYVFDVPYGVTSGEQIGKPSLLATTPEDCYLIHAGGTLGGKAAPNFLVAMSATMLYVRTAGPTAALVPKPLPVAFAKPITKLYDASGHKIESPTSHGKTVSLAVAASDASVIAVSGWLSVLSNSNVTESVWLSSDLGSSWRNVMGDLAEASATIGLARPMGMAFVDLDGGERALLVGVVNGLYVTRASAPGRWTRLGRCTELPLVIVYGIEYEASSDTLVAATLGRGVYTLNNAKAEIAKALAAA